MYQDLLNAGIENVKIISIGKGGTYENSNSDWINNTSMPIIIDPVSYETWSNWGAGQRDLYFLDANGNYANDFNISSWNYDAVYNQIIELLPEANTPPYALDLTYTLDEDTTLLLSLEGYDQDGDALNYVILEEATNGTILLYQAEVSYIPNVNFNGYDSFTYMVNDGEFDSNEATVTLIVNAVNDAPYLMNIPDAEIESSSIFTYELQAADVDGDNLYYTVSLNGDATATISNNILTIIPNSSADQIINVFITVTDGTTTHTTSFILTINASCELPFIEVDNQCLHGDDIAVLQAFIDNSYQSGLDLDCNGSPYCGSPNPYMDDPESWFTSSIDGESYVFADGDGLVEPLELGIQEWENGRLKGIMCGAYIYCQLSGPMPLNISDLSEIQTLRLEINYLSGYIPEDICELNTNYSDYLAFDLSGNYFCPPYPEYIDTSEDMYWYQNIDACYESGDLNQDGLINVVDAVLLVNNILNGDNYNPQSDLNNDSLINVVDVVILINLILGN